MSTTAGYLARRAGQKERVRLLYRRALKDTLNWAVHRHLFYQDASDLRDKFEANRNVENLDVIDRLIDDAEARQRNFQHPDPYIVPWAPGGTKFTRNPPPPEGVGPIFLAARGASRLGACPLRHLTDRTFAVSLFPSEIVVHAVERSL
ncbi:hypothetical protein QYE76_035307 [Lolium multiflorum]|uniref:NADH dehydrogenase [ubiquinone] 1 beta subcomplex subunit 9 n=1 Tax=Lolium multiflorum TaxID=4521 RepID=A0AAD8R1C2_LOLMU|nr:hypothetical protein QYE76_035307 [Lolium multiflorum]